MNATLENVTKVKGRAPGTPNAPEPCAPSAPALPCADRSPHGHRLVGKLCCLPLQVCNFINRGLAHGTSCSDRVVGRETAHPKQVPKPTFPDFSVKAALIFGRFVKVCEGL